MEHLCDPDHPALGLPGATWRRRQTLLLPAMLSGGAAAPPTAAAQADAVDLLLVLAINASGTSTLTSSAFNARAVLGRWSTPVVLSAIASRPLGVIGMALVEWGAPGGAATVGWHRVGGEVSAGRLAEAVRSCRADGGKQHCYYLSWRTGSFGSSGKPSPASIRRLFQTAVTQFRP